MSNGIYTELAELIQQWGLELGFQKVGITDTRLNEHEKYLQNWLASGYDGTMAYMSQHGLKRSRPAELIPETQRVISVRMDYLIAEESGPTPIGNHDLAYVSRYALGRDYHKVLRNRLKKLDKRIAEYLQQHQVEAFSSRLFTDSAPVLEKALAEKAGLGWIGKNTLLLHRDAGSWFFLGELFVNIPLPLNKVQVTNRCGSCTACIDICPTQAIVAPYQLDARRCISYLTIESKDSIPIEYRAAMGNRIFGCDDCQVTCPWNRYARITGEGDFSPRHGLDNAQLLELFTWTEDEFLLRTEGSAIRRTGYQGWLRNISVALGNADYSVEIVKQLQARLHGATAILGEHISWALDQQAAKKITGRLTDSSP